MLKIEVVRGVAVAGRRMPRVMSVTKMPRSDVPAAPKNASAENPARVERIVGDDQPRRRDIKRISGERRSPPWEAAATIDLSRLVPWNHRTRMMRRKVG